MKASPSWISWAAAAGLVAAQACTLAGSAVPIEDVGAATDRKVSATETVDQWEELSALAARRLIAEYGVPDAVDSMSLTWNGNGPWRRTVVRDEPPADAAGRDMGIVIQSIGYGSLTPAQAELLASFDDRLSFDPLGQELTAQSDREELNILRLNLADDVVRERRSPEQARAAYFDDLELFEAGKTVRDMTVLRMTR
jgi:hypothetical protein